MLNRTTWRYLSSRRVGPSVLATVLYVDRPSLWMRTRPAALLHTPSGTTNPASCVFFFRRFDRHASSSSSPRSNLPPSPHHSAAAGKKESMRETSPLTESSHFSEPADDDELENASTELLPSEQLSWKDRAKTFASEYGRVGIATHIVLSVMSISVIYAVISSGVDVTGLLHSLGLSTNSEGKDATVASAGSFILAYTIYKVASPLRWPLTFAVTPVVMRALRRRGYMLPKPKSHERRSPRPNGEHPESGSDNGSSRH